MSNELTPREQDVEMLMLNGNSTREIATALGISIITAGGHVRNVLAKRRAEVAAEPPALAAAPDARWWKPWEV